MGRFLTRAFLLLCSVVVAIATFASEAPSVVSAFRRTGQAASANNAASHQQLARDILKQLIEIDTSEPAGSTTAAAQAMAARLKAAGFPDRDVQVLPMPAEPHKGNLIARYRGTGRRKPLLLLAHLDVVAAKRSDWSVDPFVLTEKDGYFYGRGTSDDKAMAAIWIALLIRATQEGLRFDRDLIVALTADEEGGNSNGVQWLIDRHRELIDAELCLNEGGGGGILAGRYFANEVQASEKVYLSYTLAVKNPGGHSSRPVKDNAIYHLAEGLARLAKFDFPVTLNEVTRAYFDRMSRLQSGQLAADMKAILQTRPNAEAVSRLAQSAFFNAQMRTTCVATRLEAGHADNALPQSAQALVNCRLLPGVSPVAVQRTLEKVLADKRITVAPIDEAKASPPSPLTPDVMQSIERITRELWPGVPVVPTMGTGATDGLYLRRAGIPTYGVSGLFEDIDDVRAHGKDERIGVKQFHESQEFLYRLVRALGVPER